jgi:hypothetical protein
MCCGSYNLPICLIKTPSCVSMCGHYLPICHCYFITFYVVVFVFSEVLSFSLLLLPQHPLLFSSRFHLRVFPFYCFLSQFFLVLGLFPISFLSLGLLLLYSCFLFCSAIGFLVFSSSCSSSFLSSFLFPLVSSFFYSNYCSFFFFL